MGLDHLTFGLAFAGYLLLAADTLLRVAGREHRTLTVVLALVVAAHVACVWGLRFEWQVERAVDGRLAGFVLFHGALLLIAVAPLTRGRAALGLLAAAFAIVSIGAIGAAFKYDVVAALQIPLLIACAATIASAAWLARRRRRPTTE